MKNVTRRNFLFTVGGSILSAAIPFNYVSGRFDSRLDPFEAGWRVHLFLEKNWMWKNLRDISIADLEEAAYRKFAEFGYFKKKDNLHCLVYAIQNISTDCYKIHTTFRFEPTRKFTVCNYSSNGIVENEGVWFEAMEADGSFASVKWCPHTKKLEMVEI